MSFESPSYRIYWMLNADKINEHRQLKKNTYMQIILIQSIMKELKEGPCRGPYLIVNNIILYLAKKKQPVHSNHLTLIENSFCKRCTFVLTEIFLCSLKLVLILYLSKYYIYKKNIAPSQRACSPMTHVGINQRVLVLQYKIN